MSVRRPLRTVALDVGKGAAVGIAIAGGLMAIGLVRFVVYLFGGRGSISWPSAADLRMPGFYIGSFAFAGALLGAVRPLLRTKAGMYVGQMVGGIIVMCGITLSDLRSFAAFDAQDWGFAIICGALFGAAGAYGWFRAGP